jgi:hypothetical protein
MAMRLLTIDDNGRFILERFAKDRIPPYAILSHRWSIDGKDEMTFEEMYKGVYDERKSGYKKLQFCRTQAKADNLHYFWVDTCCIDQSNQNELSNAIYSMFRWYQKAVKCYVYLADIYIGERDSEAIRIAKDSILPKSEWFSRGWTLQELLAPGIVEFFSQDGVKLGDKNSLKRQIMETTGIPIPYLQGRSFSHLDSEQIFKWVDQRKTTKEEDKAYCLLGILDVSMLLDYGEGQENAFSRLTRETERRVPGKDG